MLVTLAWADEKCEGIILHFVALRAALLTHKPHDVNVFVFLFCHIPANASAFLLLDKRRCLYRGACR
jgi:hypothetical protein